MPMATGCSTKAAPKPPAPDTTGQLIDAGRWGVLAVGFMAAVAAIVFFNK